jgi:hypothetical protein
MIYIIVRDAGDINAGVAQSRSQRISFTALALIHPPLPASLSVFPRLYSSCRLVLISIFP